MADLSGLSTLDLLLFKILRVMYTYFLRPAFTVTETSVALFKTLLQRDCNTEQVTNATAPVPLTSNVATGTTVRKMVAWSF